jgi:FkbM family methyltransferase
MARKQGYRGVLTCFEPNPQAASCIPVSLDAEVRQVALSDQANQVAILNIYSKSDFSSLNKLRPQFACRYGINSDLAESLQLITSTLDEQYLKGDHCLLKIDTQGFELNILKGSSKLLPRCSALLLEVAFLPLYEEAPLAGVILPYLSSLGFELSRIFPVTFVGDCIADADCFFVRLP